MEKMIKKFDDKGQMFVYEAIAVVIMIIAAVVFFINLSSTPTISRSDPLHQLQTYGDDALRSYDYKNLDINENNIIGHLETMLPIDASYYLILNTGDSEYIFTLDGTDIISVNWNNIEFDDETVTSHRIMADPVNGIVDVQLMLWYENI